MKRTYICIILITMLVTSCRPVPPPPESRQDAPDIRSEPSSEPSLREREPIVPLSLVHPIPVPPMHEEPDAPKPPKPEPKE